MKTNNVRIPKEFGELVYASNSQRLVQSVWHVRIIENDIESKTLRSDRRRRADPPATDDPENPTAQSRDRSGLIHVPIANSTLKPAVEKMRSASEGQGHGQGGIGDFLGSVIRHVANRNPVLSRRLDVHSIVTDTGPDDDFAIPQALDAGASETEIVINHDRVGILDLTFEISLAHRVQRGDFSGSVEDAALEIERFDDQICDNDFGYLIHDFCERRLRIKSCFLLFSAPDLRYNSTTMRPDDQIFSFLNSIRSRLSKHRLLSAFIGSIAVGAAALLLICLAYVLRGHAVPPIAYALAGGAILLGGVAGWIWRRPTESTSAEFGDQFFDLKDSVGSFLRFRNDGREGELFGLQAQSTAKRVSELDPAEVRYKWPSRMLAGAAVLMASAVLLGFKAPSPAVIEAERLAAETEAKTEEINEHLEELIEELEKATEDDEELAELDKDQLRKWVDELKNTTDRKERCGSTRNWSGVCSRRRSEWISGKMSSCWRKRARN
ncbi:MAG: hypothetical protein ACI8UO_003530 [Verrucomicrobiales bacterium]|jgi:hypothetical protein